jgi:hypothetical protein
VDSGQKRTWSFPMTAPVTPDGTWSQGPWPEGVSVAPDGGGAVATVSYDVCQDDWRNALVYIDLVTGEATELVPAGDKPLMRAVVGWPDGGELVISEHPPFTSPAAPRAVERRMRLP